MQGEQLVFGQDLHYLNILERSHAILGRLVEEGARLLKHLAREHRAK